MKTGMRDLLRSPDGVIDRVEFLRGIRFVGGLTIVAALLFYAITELTSQMEWMTVNIAPFLGVIVFFVVCSILYFWFCLFVKMMRGSGRSIWPVYVWLALPVFAAIFRLIKFENDSLDLMADGIFAISGILAIVFSALFLLMSLYLLVLGLAKAETR